MAVIQGRSSARKTHITNRDLRATLWLFVRLLAPILDDLEGYLAFSPRKVKKFSPMLTVVGGPASAFEILIRARGELTDIRADAHQQASEISCVSLSGFPDLSQRQVGLILDT